MQSKMINNDQQKTYDTVCNKQGCTFKKFAI